MSRQLDVFMLTFRAGRHRRLLIYFFALKVNRNCDKMANDTPESDFSIECFQNYSAPEVFVQGLAGMVNQNDVETVIRAQKNMYAVHYCLLSFALFPSQQDV